MTTRCRIGLAIGTAAALAAILEVAVGVSAWRGHDDARPPGRGRAAPVVREWEPPVDVFEAAFDAGPIESPEVAGEKIRVGATPTGRPLYMGPNGGIYHRGAGGRKVYHPDRRIDR